MNRALVIFLVLVLILFVAAAGYLLGKGNFSIRINSTPSPSAQPTLTSEPIVDETEAIKAAVYQKFGSNETELMVTVSEIEGAFAKGGVREKSSEVGGGYFLAAKTEGKWKVVHDGQASPFCTQIAPYNFPTSMVSECLNSQGGVVTR